MKTTGITVTSEQIQLCCTTCSKTLVLPNTVQNDFQAVLRIIRVAKKEQGWVHRHNGIELLCPTCYKPIKEDTLRNPKESKVNVEEAIQFYNDGSTYDDLAELYGVTKTRVQHLLKDRVNKERPQLIFCPFCSDNLTEENHQQAPERRVCDKEECLLASGAFYRCKCGKLIKGRRAKNCQVCWGVSKRQLDYGVAADLYSKGANGDQIAKVLRVSPITIYKALDRYEVSPGKKVEKRPRFGPKLLSQRQVQTLYKELRKEKK
jgi:hypothetical protein